MESLNFPCCFFFNYIQIGNNELHNISFSTESSTQKSNLTLLNNDDYVQITLIETELNLFDPPPPLFLATITKSGICCSSYHSLLLAKAALAFLKQKVYVSPDFICISLKCLNWPIRWQWVKEKNLHKSCEWSGINWFCASRNVQPTFLAWHVAHNITQLYHTHTDTTKKNRTTFMYSGINLCMATGNTLHRAPGWRCEQIGSEWKLAEDELRVRSRKKRKQWKVTNENQTKPNRLWLMRKWKN